MSHAIIKDIVNTIFCTKTAYLKHKSDSTSFISFISFILVDVLKLFTSNYKNKIAQNDST